MSPHEITIMFVALGMLLAAARILGETAQWFHQPAVVGEILAGILLGPTVLGQLAPQWSTTLFPTTGHGAIVLDGLSILAITLFLLVAGMEVDISTAWRQGTTAMKVASVGMVVPFATGFLAAWYVPQAMGGHPEADRLIFALFFATALAISALPVIAKTLMDLNLYRSDLGMVIISAAVINDLVGWIIFAVVLGMIGGGASAAGFSLAATIGLALGFSLVMLTLGRWLIHRALPYVQAYTHWPGGVLSFSFVLALFGAAFTEWIGIHAIFGAFMVGVAIGDSAHLRERTRATIDNFVSFIFAPLFFASIGLRVNFATHFDVSLMLVILVIACAGKLVGCGLGARWGGMSPRDSLGVAFAMNARGAMEIILGVLALEAGIIRARLFVALVVMALVTSMMSGPMLQFAMGRRKSPTLIRLLSSKAFVRRLQATTASEAIRELVLAAASAADINSESVEAAVLEREQIMSTGVGERIAFPHARISGLRSPLLAVGLSESGIDFNAPDGEPAQVIFLVLTPIEDSSAQLEILAEIARIFQRRERVEQVLKAGNFAEFIAVLKSQADDQVTAT